MHIQIETVPFAFRAPFIITGHVFEVSETVRVSICEGPHTGRGEALGAFYLNETAASMTAQLEDVIPELEAHLSAESIQKALPACGARNALDCAYWDFKAKQSGQSIWRMLGLEPKTLTTVYTLGLDTPEAMGEHAARAKRFPNLKIKLNASTPVERLEAIRAARSDATLIVDVNQGWSLDELREYLPHAQRLGIAMIEQPLPKGQDALLEGFKSPVPLGADESCCHLGEFDAVSQWYDVINIKLDKCGGLTEGLALVKAAQAKGVGLMVGNMCGTSLSMAPSYVIGQFCQFIDIDGPLLLKHDVEHGLNYADGGVVSLPSPELWG